MLQLAVLHTTSFGGYMVRTPLLRKYLHRFTVGKGREFDNPKSKARIEAFIDEYAVDLATVPRPLSEYLSLIHI